MEKAIFRGARLHHKQCYWWPKICLMRFIYWVFIWLNHSTSSAPAHSSLATVFEGILMVNISHIHHKNVSIDAGALRTYLYRSGPSTYKRNWQSFSNLVKRWLSCRRLPIHKIFSFPSWSRNVRSPCLLFFGFGTYQSKIYEHYWRDYLMWLLCFLMLCSDVK